MKNKSFKLFLLLGVVITLFFSSCTSLNQSLREPNTKVQLTKSDFTLSDQVVAEATQIKIIGIDWQRLFKKQEGTISVPIMSTNIRTGKVERFAIYNLLSQNAGYDVIFYPTFDKKRINILGIYQKTEVKVKARLGKLNN